MAAPAIILDEKAQENGLALMLRDLLTQNLEQHPEKIRAFCMLSASVAITAQDADVRLTLYFNRGSCIIYDGLATSPKLHILADAETILALSNVPLRAGLPDLFKPDGRALGKSILTGKLKIKGLLLHPLTVILLTQVFSVR